MMICPKCGRKSTEVRFIEAFCVDCYPYNLKLPESIEIEICKRCGKMRLKGEWIPYKDKFARIWPVRKLSNFRYNKNKIEEYAVSKCRGDFADAKYDIESGKITFIIKKGETEVEVERQLPFKKIITICPECSRIAGGYYEAIIQLRGDPKKIAKYSKTIIRVLKTKTFITKTEEKHGGIDIFVGSTKAVLEVCGMLGLHAIITKKLMGRREGKRYYRTTFSIRFESSDG